VLATVLAVEGGSVMLPLRWVSCGLILDEATIPSRVLPLTSTGSEDAEPERENAGRSLNIWRSLGEAVMPSSPVGLYCAWAWSAGMRVEITTPVISNLFVRFMNSLSLDFLYSQSCNRPS